MTTESISTGKVQPAGDKQPRFDELEAYRGLAAVMIVVFHAYQHSREGTGRAEFVYDGRPLDTFFRSLEVGVGWFFVLSGFLVFLPFARAAVQAGRFPSSRGFLVRRAIRILPAYYTAIVVVWAVRYTGSPDQWPDLIAHLTFTHVFSDQYIFSTIGPAWSLGVEVLFYAFLSAFGPLSIWMCRRLSPPLSRALVLSTVLVGMAWVSIAYKWWAMEIASIPETRFSVYFGPIAKLDTLMFGMLLAVVVALVGDQVVLPGVTPAILRCLGLAVVAATFIAGPMSDFVSLYFTTFAALGFLPILASSVLARRGTTWERLLSLSVFQGLGIVSYGIYLWHEPILVEFSKREWMIRNVPSAFPTNALSLVLLAIVVGTISYWAVEKPTMYLKHLFKSDGTRAPRYPSEDLPGRRRRRTVWSETVRD